MTGDRVLVLRAPMVGRVVEILIEAGASCASGDELVILESMKMEIPVLAPRDGTIQEVRVNPGDTVQEDDVLLLLE